MLEPRCKEAQITCNHKGYYAPNMLRKKEFAGVTERTSAKTLALILLKREKACVSVTNKQKASELCNCGHARTNHFVKKGPLLESGSSGRSDGTSRHMNSKLCGIDVQ